MKKTVGVFFGSRSPEHDVSIITGQLIIAGLKKLDYNVEAVYIDKQGKWLLGNTLNQLKYFTDPNLNSKLKNISEFYLELEASLQKGVFKKTGILAKKYSIDIAFPAFHGQFGEDGTFQGMCEMLNIPYVGCDTTSSAVTMDKVLTKMLYKANNIPTTNFVYFYKGDWQSNKKEILNKIVKEIGFPVIVKPARLGSSIGIAKANNLKDLEFAIEVALHYDKKIIVEDLVEDLIDITCAVLGNDEPIASLLQESVFTSDFFTYEDKYLKEGGAQLGNAKQNIIIPARLDKTETELIRKTAVEIFRLLGCSGISRVDFLVDKKTGRWFANEVNTLPGTLYHHLWKASGIELDELLNRLIKLAEERFEEKKGTVSTFESSILKQAGSTKLKMLGK